MTTSNLMSLPVDIAWKRLAFDSDMMRIAPLPPQAATIRKDAPSWNPTIAIFYAYPDPDSIPKEYEDMIITYLKVVCSITGTTPLRKESLGKSLPPDHPAYNIIANNLALYYGCYGAILEVTVAPYGVDAWRVAFDEYPYFFDFEPKKREIYEDVTDSGEILSGSKEDLQVRKSGTSSSGTEITTGNVIPSTQPPYKQDFHEEVQNIRNIDASREYRETASHTTKLSQLYHQLDSYYPGTNRALFFIQPRPHIANPKYLTFLNGPRQLEGIQEFFLVVMQPKSRPGLCVSAELSTGHLAFNKIEDQIIQPKIEPKSVEIPFKAVPPPSIDWVMTDIQTFKIGDNIWPKELPVDESIQVWLDDSVNKDEVYWNNVKEGRPLNQMQGPGWALKFNTEQSVVVIEKQVWEDDHPTNKTERKEVVTDILVTPDASGITVKTIFPNSLEGKIIGTLEVFLKVKQLGNIMAKGQEIIDFFVRHNGAGACLDPQGKITPRHLGKKTATDTTHVISVGFSDAKVVIMNPWLKASSTTPSGISRAIRDLNTRIVEVMRDLKASMASLPETGPWANPLHTDFALKLFRKDFQKVKDIGWLQTSIQDLPEVSDSLKERLLQNGIGTRIQLLERPLEQLQQMLQLSNEKTRDLYLNAWDVPSQVTKKRPKR